MARETSIEFDANSHHHKSQPIMFMTDEVTLGEPYLSESAPSLAETCHSLPSTYLVGRATASNYKANLIKFINRNSATPNPVFSRD